MTQQNPTAGELNAAEAVILKWLTHGSKGALYDWTLPRVAEVIHSALETERRELVEALRPFASLDINHMEEKPDDRPVFGSNRTLFTLGDVRKARALLAKYED